MSFVEKGSAAYLYWEQANELRQRLQRPPNAVKDKGINLKKSRQQPIVLVKKSTNGVVIPTIDPLLKHFKELPTISVIEIRRATSLYFNIPIDIINGPSRRVQVVLARHLAVYLARNRTKRTWHEIMPFFGSRDHTTLLHGWKKISFKVLAGNEEIIRHIDHIWSIVNDYRRQFALSAKPEQHLAVQLEDQKGVPGPGLRSLEETGSPALDGGEAEGFSDGGAAI